MNKHGDLRVWWIPQVPCQEFYVPVKSLEEADMLLNALADYDKFQLDNKIKPDYCNAGGLMIWDENCIDEETGDCWVDWNDDETGECFDEYRDRVFK